MLRLKNIDKEIYDNYVKNHPTKSHFLQSHAWGEFSKVKKGLTPYYLGLVNENDELVAATLLLQKMLPLGYCYFYAPRGFVLDYNKKELVKTMTKQIAEFAQKKKAIFVKIDPDIIYKNYNYLNEEIKPDADPEKIYETLKEVGFKHLGFTKNFETMQPRYTFRIDLTQPLEEIEDHFSKTTKQRIAKSLKLETEVTIGTKNDIKEFYHLMTLTENRKDFITHNEAYYKSLYEIWNQDNSCNLFLGSVNLDKIINKQNNTLDELKEELSKLPTENLSKSQNTKKQELEKRISKINSDLTRYIEIRNEYGSDITLSAHFIIEYADKAWVLYAGNHNILTDTYTNYETYKDHIKYYYDKNIKTYDQFGTIGDLRKDNPLLGLHEFKKKFGGDYVEFTGEFDYIINKPMYFIFTKLVPIYRNLVKKLAKKKRGQK